MALVTPTDRPKSVRGRVIEFFVAFLYHSFAFIEFSVGFQASIIGQSDHFLYLFCYKDTMAILQCHRIIVILCCLVEMHICM